MCAPGLTAVLVAAAILSNGGCTLAHRAIFRWDPFLHQHLPIDATIDVVNRLTVEVLQDYAFSRGNFAFSPYGATSVLVALYEGSRGESARQIHAALRLPWNHDVVRIGFRDLQRRLRVYFVHEGFLNGLTFNKNMTEFRPEYISALRFYGYEVEPATRVPSTTSQSPQITTSSVAPDKFSTEFETFSTTTQPSTDSAGSGNAGVTTEEQPESTTAGEHRTESATSETTVAFTGKSTKSTTETPSESTTEIPELTTESSQATTLGITTVSEIFGSTGTTSGYVTTTEVQSSTTVSGTFTTENQAAGAGITTEGVESTQKTETPQENTQVTDVTLGLDGKTTETSSTETTVSKTTTEQTIPIGSTRPDLPATEVGNVDEQTSTIQVTETTATNFPEILEATVAEKFTSTPNGATQDEKVTTQSSVSATPAIPFTTDDIVSESFTLSSTTDQISTSGLLTGNTDTTSEKVVPVTSEDIPYVSTSSEGVETIYTINDEKTSTTELSTESLSTTSLANEGTETPTSFANTDETSTYSEQTVTSSPTDASDAVERKARSIPADDANTWLGNVIRSEATRRLVKRSFIGGGGDFSLQLENGMLESSGGRGLERDEPQLRLPFLVDGVLEEKVPVSSYTAVLPFAYVPRLDALALQLPLENEWHRLVILLPLERRGLQELIYNLRSFPLGLVMKSLHRTRVNAIIPNIVVEGFVVLTPTLQKLGIWDVFDPRRADLSGMSRDPELYVRELEQTISVDISSKSRIPELHNKGKAGRHRIEPFSATHPFLYFVVDRDTNVPLIVGKMVDPLNSRIH